MNLLHPGLTTLYQDGVEANRPFLIFDLERNAIATIAHGRMLISALQVTNLSNQMVTWKNAIDGFMTLQSSSRPYSQKFDKTVLYL